MPIDEVNKDEVRNPADDLTDAELRAAIRRYMEREDPGGGGGGGGSILAALFGGGKLTSAQKNLLTNAGLTLGTSLLSSTLNSGGNARTSDQQRVEAAQADELEARNRDRDALRALVGQLAGNPRPDIFRFGEEYDYSTIAPTAELDWLARLAGLDAPTGSVTAGAGLQAQADQSALDSTGNTIGSLLRILLSRDGGANDPAPTLGGNNFDLSGLNLPFSLDLF